MRVLAIPSDTAACGHYRLRLPAQVLTRLECGVSIDIVERLAGYVSPAGELVALEAHLLEYDVVVLQRPMTDWQVTSIRLFQEAGVAVVVEIDDDFEALHKDNTALLTVKPQHKANLRQAAKLADLVTVTTPNLATRYARHGRYAILPNYVSSELLSIGADRRGDVVGWAGTCATHPNDLQTTSGGIGSAVEATGATFRVIGRPELVARNLRLPREPQLVPWTDINLYPHELARLDIGIAPLANTVFNRAKSHLKPLEMAAVGVPVIMSDVGEYRALADAGIGILASSGLDWHATVVALLTNEHLRDEISAMGRQVVREHYLIEAHAWRWAQAWDVAVARRQYRGTCV